MSRIDFTIIDRASMLTMRPVSEIMSRRADAALTCTRYAIMRTLRKRGWSLPRIGDALGRHHTTIIHGLKRADDLANNPGFKLLCRELEAVA